MNPVVLAAKNNGSKGDDTRGKRNEECCLKTKEVPDHNEERTVANGLGYRIHNLICVYVAWKVLDIERKHVVAEWAGQKQHDDNETIANICTTFGKIAYAHVAVASFLLFVHFRVIQISIESLLWSQDAISSSNGSQAFLSLVEFICSVVKFG